MQDRNYTLDFYKFIASLFIAVLHLHWRYAPQAYLFVEFFFLTSGFMIGLNITKYKRINIFTIARKRLHSFYLSYFFALFLYIYIYNYNAFYFLIALTMLPYIGIFQCIPLPYWFLGAYFYFSIIYIILLHFLSTRRFFFLIILIIISFMSCYFCIGYLPINHALDRDFLFFPYSVFRAIVGLGLGICAGYFFKKFHHLFPEKLSIYLQAFSILLLLYYIPLAPTPAFDIINYIVMMGLIMSSFYINRVNSAFALISRKFYKLVMLYLDIYVWHPVLIGFFEKMHIIDFFVDHIFIYLFLVIIFSYISKKMIISITRYSYKEFINENK